MLERDEPPCCRLDRLPTGKETMIAEYGCFPRSEGLSNPFTFRSRQHGAIVDVEENMVFVEGETVL